MKNEAILNPQDMGEIITPKNGEETVGSHG